VVGSIDFAIQMVASIDFYWNRHRKRSSFQNSL